MGVGGEVNGRTVYAAQERKVIAVAEGRFSKFGSAMRVNLSHLGSTVIECALTLRPSG